MLARVVASTATVGGGLGTRMESDEAIRCSPVVEATPAIGLTPGCASEEERAAVDSGELTWWGPLNTRLIGRRHLTWLVIPGT